MCPGVFSWNLTVKEHSEIDNACHFDSELVFESGNSSFTQEFIYLWQSIDLYIILTSTPKYFFSFKIHLLSDIKTGRMLPWVVSFSSMKTISFYQKVYSKTSNRKRNNNKFIIILCSTLTVKNQLSISVLLSQNTIYYNELYL